MSLGHSKFVAWRSYGEERSLKERDRDLLVKSLLILIGVCVGVQDSSAGLLKFLDKNGIAGGIN